MKFTQSQLKQMGESAHMLKSTNYRNYNLIKGFDGEIVVYAKGSELVGSSDNMVHARVLVDEMIHQNAKHESELR